MQGAGNRQRYSTNNETPASACDSGCQWLAQPLLILTKLLGPNRTFRYNIERGYEERPGCRGVLRHEKMSQTSDNSTSFPGSSLFLPQAAQPRHESVCWRHFIEKYTTLLCNLLMNLCIFSQWLLSISFWNVFSELQLNRSNGELLWLLKPTTWSWNSRSGKWLIHEIISEIDFDGA